jgi:hypothetical protein
MAEQPLGFTPGDARRISAVVRAYEAGELGPGTQLQEQLTDRNYAKIPFRNDSGEVLPAHGLIRVGNMVQVDGRYIWSANKPDSTYRRLYLVNSATDWPIGAAGWGTWLWHADYVLYDTGNTPTFGETWGPEASSWTIKKDSPGFIIQGGNAGSGVTSRTIAIQQQTPLWGKPDGSYSADGTGTATLWDRAFSGSLGLTVSSVIFRTRDVTTATRVSITSDGVAFPIDCEDA